MAKAFSLSDSTALRDEATLRRVQHSAVRAMVCGNGVCSA